MFHSSLLQYVTWSSEIYFRERTKEQTMKNLNKYINIENFGIHKKGMNTWLQKLIRGGFFKHWNCGRKVTEAFFFSLVAIILVYPNICVIVAISIFLKVQLIANFHWRILDLQTYWNAKCWTSIKGMDLIELWEKIKLTKKKKTKNEESRFHTEFLGEMFGMMFFTLTNSDFVTFFALP